MNFLRDTTVLILGLGDSGLAMARWCVRHGAQVSVWDSRDVAPQDASLAQELPQIQRLQALPLPDGYAPDEIDALLLVDNFPSLPPIGLYVLNHGNDQVVTQLRRRFNAFQDRAFHDAPSIDGYTWICYAYAGNAWRYRASEPHKGDNLRKFVASFFAEAKA